MTTLDFVCAQHFDKIQQCACGMSNGKKAIDHLMSMFWQRTGSPGFGCGNERRASLHEVGRGSGAEVDVDPTIQSAISAGATVPTLLPSRLDLDLLRNIDLACQRHRRMPLRPPVPGA